MKTLHRDGVSLAYQEAGSGGGRPMLFVHGWGCNHAHFTFQQAFFGQTRRTVAMDLRGHGASDAPGQAYTVAAFVEDLAWQCRQLGLTKPIVIGHSMGGNIALEFAARHPALVEAIVAIDSVMFPQTAFVERLQSLREALRGADYVPVVEQVVGSLFIPADDPVERRRITASIAATRRHVLESALVGHIIDYDAAPAAAACKCPVGYIGAEIPLVDLARFRQLTPQLSVGQTMGSGHFSPLLVPDQINAMLLGFERACIGG
jgi:pimeloyl-ACP methyl ester carboxylesterase